MALEILLSPTQEKNIHLEWNHGEFRLNFKAPPLWIEQLLQMILQLSRFRGEMNVDFMDNGKKDSLVVRDVFNEVVSYEWLDYGKEPINSRRFQRLAYGKMGLREFQESIYAALTDMGVLLGTLGYEEILGMKFPFSPYSQLAKKLGRPHDIPEEGEEEFVESSEEEGFEGNKDWVWETEDGESTFESDDPPPWLRDPKELQTRDEFLILGELINKKKSDSSSDA